MRDTKKGLQTQHRLSLYLGGSIGGAHTVRLGISMSLLINCSRWSGGSAQDTMCAAAS